MAFGRKGKGSVVVVVAEAMGLPIAAVVAAANTAESHLAEEALTLCAAEELPKRLIGDKAYDSDPLDAQLQEKHGVDMIAPNRKARSQTQDGRPLRRAKRRWKVERLIAWLQNFRRLVIRYERYADRSSRERSEDERTFSALFV